MDDFLEPLQRRRSHLRKLGDRLNIVMARKLSLERAIDDYNAFDPGAVSKVIGLLSEECEGLSKK